MPNHPSALAFTQPKSSSAMTPSGLEDQVVMGATARRFLAVHFLKEMGEKRLGRVTRSF